MIRPHLLTASLNVMRQCHELWSRVVWTSYRRIFWRGYSTNTDCTCQRNHYELIPTVKMEARNPVEGYFVVSFQW